MWRSALYQTVTASSGLYPGNLGIFLHSQAAVTQQYTTPVEKANGRLMALPPSWHQLCGDFEFTAVMLKHFVCWIDEGLIYAGSDGSVLHQKGTHSFVWTSGEDKTCISGGAGTTPGNVDEMASQRAEHARFIAFMAILLVLS